MLEKKKKDILIVSILKKNHRKDAQKISNREGLGVGGEGGGEGVILLSNKIVTFSSKV